MQPHLHVLAALIAAALTSPGFAGGGDVITYQGELRQAGAPVTDLCDLRFLLFDDDTGGSPVAPTVEAFNVPVVEGRIVHDLDFGPGIYDDGGNRWIEIQVRCPAGSGTFTTLSPRQKIQSAPYAHFARNADVPFTFSGNNAVFNGGNVAVGTNNADVKMHVAGGSDAALAGGGYYQAGASASINLVWDNNELMARNNAAASDLFLNNEGGDVLISAAGTGRLGIGASSPQADIHIRGQDALGSMLITPSIANSNSQIFLAEQQAESFGMILRYDGSANQLQFIAQQSFVETDPLFVLTRGSAGRVGIGTTSPSARLHVAGDVHVEGDVSMTPRMRTMMISAAAFEHEDLFGDLDVFFGGRPELLNVNAIGGASRSAGAAVSLPHGAVVTQFSAAMLDSAPSQNLTVSLQHLNFDAFAIGAAMATVTSSGSGGQQIRSDTSISSATINNQTDVYWVEVTFPPGTPVFDLALYAVRITYQIDSLD